MKKSLLLLFCIAAYCSASALELSFWLGNKQIAPGETVEFTDITVDESGGYLDVKMKPALYLKSDTYTTDVKITASCTSGQSIGLCAGGKCIGGETVVKEDIIIATGAKLDLGFDYMGEFDLGEDVPTVVTVFEAEDVTVPGSKVQFTLKMGKDLGSITAVQTSQKLTSAKGGIRYAATVGSKLSVYTLAGNVVFDKTLYGDGFIALPRGLYIYRLGNTAGKIYVKE